mgnify:CR=1 FL=1
MSQHFGLGEAFFDDDTERAPGEETAEEGVNIQMISTSTIRISVVTAQTDLERAARALHTAFGLDSGQAYSAPLPERK